MSSLLDRYWENDPALLECYAGSAASLFDCAPDARVWDPELVESIRAFNAAMDHHPEFVGDEAVIITGQQPAVLGGPLYSVYKAITTIKLAEQLAQKTGAHVVPMFWVGSEDHDFDEAASVYFPTRKQTSDRLSLPHRPEYHGKAIHQISINEDTQALIDTLVEHAPGGEFRGEVESFLRESAAASSSLSDWSTRILARFFRDTPLVFFAPHLEAARRSGAAVIRAAIENPLATTRAVNAGAARMNELGYPAQVEKNDSECAFFHEVDGVRAKVTYEGGQFHLPELKKSLRSEEFLAALQSNPERFSPNVALRCIVQQHLFPVAAYVAGPGELAYWGQFKGVFEAFDTCMPIVYPRIQALLTTTKLNKLRDKYALPYSALLGPQHELITQALSTIDTSAAVAIVTNARNDITEQLNALADNLSKEAPVAASMAQGLTADLIKKLNRLEQNVLYSDESRRASVENHVNRLQAMLAPNRKPQERMHSVATYLFEYGWGLKDRLLKELSLDRTGVQEVEL